MAKSDFNSQSQQTGPALDLLLAERPQLLNFVRARVNDSDVAEEILQKASLKLIAHGGSLRDGARAKAWVYRILRNELFDHYRRRAVHERRAAQLDPDTVAVPVRRTRLCPCAVEELSALRPGYSEALRTMEMEDEPIASHASRKRISVSNATVRLHRARKALRARVEKRCGRCAGAGCFDCDCAATM